LLTCSEINIIFFSNLLSIHRFNLGIIYMLKYKTSIRNILIHFVTNRLSDLFIKSFQVLFSLILFGTSWFIYASGFDVLGKRWSPESILIIVLHFIFSAVSVIAVLYCVRWCNICSGYLILLALDKYSHVYLWLCTKLEYILIGTY